MEFGYGKDTLQIVLHHITWILNDSYQVVAKTSIFYYDLKIIFKVKFKTRKSNKSCLREGPFIKSDIPEL